MTPQDLETMELFIPADCPTAEAWERVRVALLTATGVLRVVVEGRALEGDEE
jgi:hypothetical protein